jgi:hypothetical protein
LCGAWRVCAQLAGLVLAERLRRRRCGARLNTVLVRWTEIAPSRGGPMPGLAPAPTGPRGTPGPPSSSRRTCTAPVTPCVAAKTRGRTRYVAIGAPLTRVTNEGEIPGLTASRAPWTGRVRLTTRVARRRTVRRYRARCTCVRAAAPYSAPERTSRKRVGLHKTRPVRRAAGGPSQRNHRRNASSTRPAPIRRS